MNGTGEAPWPVYGHTAALGSQVGVVIHSEKYVECTTLFRYDTKYSAHKIPSSM